MEEKEQLEQMPVETGDSLGKDVNKELKEILEEDIIAYKKKLAQIVLDKANYKKQVDLDIELFEIILNKDTYYKTVPTMKYEENPRYWEIQREKLAFKIRDDTSRANSSIEEYDYQTEKITEDMNDKIEKLEKLE